MADVDINKQSFSKLIEDYIITHKGIEYIEAILAICEKHEVDPRDCKRLLTKSIMEKVEVEAMNLNMLQGGKSLSGIGYINLTMHPL